MILNDFPTIWAKTKEVWIHTWICDDLWYVECAEIVYLIRLEGPSNCTMILQVVSAVHEA
jgi:hypothetical protein